MIKINLLPYRAERKKELIKQQIIIGTIPLLLTAFVIGLFWWSLNSKIAQAEDDIEYLKQQIKQSKLKMKDIDDYKKKKATLTKKMEIISSLQKNKAGPVHILDEIASNLPGNVWLTQVQQKGTALIMEGKALDNISISNYMVQLEKSAYFHDIQLEEIKTSSSRGAKGIQLKSFKLNTKIQYHSEEAEGAQAKGKKAA